MPEFWKRRRADGTFGNTWWTSVDGERVSTKKTDLEAARIWKRAEQRRRADPRLAAAEAASLGDLVRDLKSELRRRGRSSATLKRCDQKLGHFVRLWGARLPLAAITYERVGAYIDHRERGVEGEEAPVARLTIRDELAFLRQGLKLQKRMRRFPWDVEDVMPSAFETGAQPGQRWLLPEQLEALLSELPADRAAHAAWFVLSNGRYSDSLRARRDDLDPKGRGVWVRAAKTRANREARRRSVPVPEFLVPLLEMVAANAGPDVLFTDWQNMSRTLRLAARRVVARGLPMPARVTSTDLRRTHGKWHRLHGYTPQQIAALFGHTTSALAERIYATLDGAELPIVLGMPGTEKPGARVPNLYRRDPYERRRLRQLRDLSAENAAPPARVERATNALGRLTSVREYRLTKRGFTEVDRERVRRMYSFGEALDEAMALGANEVSA